MIEGAPQAQDYSKIASMLLSSLRKLTFYPSMHPMVKNAISETHSLISDNLIHAKELTFSISDGGLMVNNEAVTGKNQRLVDELTSEIRRLKIESVTFSEGVSSAELEDFLKTMLTGNVNQIAAEHIRINEFSYIKIEKDKEVVVEEKKKAKTPAPTFESQEELISLIAKEFADKKKITSSLKSAIKRALSRSSEAQRENLISQLEERFKQAGYPANETENVSVLIEDMFKPKERMVKISASELNRLKNDKERTDNIIRHIADGLVVVDSEDRIMLVNPAAEKILGLSQGALLGRPLHENIKDEHLLALVKDLKEEPGGAMTKDIEMLGPDESTRKILRASSAVIENQDRKTVGMVTILNDVTRQRELERLKSDFVANVSHELRTPLAVVQQNLSLLAQGLAGNLSEDQKKFISSSQDNLARLTRLINDLLDMAAIEAGKLKLKIAKVDINESVRGVVDFIGRWTKAKALSIDLKLLPSKTELDIDKDRIEQVITNLLSNAIKFTPEGGRILVSMEEEGPLAVCISVKDTGIGIEPKDIEKIFNKFEQLDTVSRSGFGGTGLGLPIAKEIIQLHGGKLWVETKPGEGSRFSFTLPKTVGR